MAAGVEGFMGLVDDISGQTGAVRAPSGDPILVPGETCWRVERAHRAAFLIDAKAYFQAAKAAMLQARHSILIVGWDFDPRIRLEPDRPEGAEPDVLGDLLEWLVEQRPSLQVGVLRWDMFFAMAFRQHPKLPLRLLDRRSDDRLKARLDSRHPLGAGHHQKLLVVDDAVAFCGGIDLAGDRWDEPGHPDHLARLTPDGFPYTPHHDVMMAVNGPAAAALGELARRRWQRATGTAFAGAAGEEALWPGGLAADLSDIDVGIARTEPDWYSQPAVRENEALFLRSIEAARDYVYLESQYLTVHSVANALARRLAEPNGPEVVIVIPQHSPGWFDRLAMDTGRESVIRHLRAADRHGRLRIYAPFSAGGRPIVVHAKLSIVDDRFIRVGTANLNHRGMGFDTECDLAVDAASGSSPAAAVRCAARDLRDSLLGEHLGMSRNAVSQAIAETGSLVAGIEALRRAQEGRLRPVDGRPSDIHLPLSGPNPLDPEDAQDVWWLAARSYLQRFRVAVPPGLAGLAAVAWLALRRYRRSRR